MNMGASPVIGVVDTYSQPGTYELLLPCPRTRTTALIQLTMVDAYKLEYRDEFPLSFHMHWYKFVKVHHRRCVSVPAQLNAYVCP